MTSPRMPALFLGHGSPMNVLEDNIYTRAWRHLGETVPRPRAIVVVSAHCEHPWHRRYRNGTPENDPRFRRFTGAVRYALPAPGSPALAQQLVDLLAPVPVTLDKEAWGFDHGSWGVLIKMYPDADIPMVQLIGNASQQRGIWRWAVSSRLCAMRASCWLPVATWYITCVQRAGLGKHALSVGDGIQ